MRQNIKSAKKSTPKSPEQDLKALRQEVKELMKKFKDGKRQQRSRRRAARRERRAVRRAEMKERRQAKREDRKARKALRKGKNKDEGTEPRPFMFNRHPVHPAVGAPFMPPMVTPHMPAMARGFPNIPMFGRGGPQPFGSAPSGPPGMSSMHAGWPFTQGHPYSPGRIALQHYMGFPTPVSQGAEHIHAQALKLETDAKEKDSQAIQIRAVATGGNVDEKRKLKNLDEAAKLEEEAEDLRREAERLRAEALHLDQELAKELEEEHSGRQVSGTIQH